MKIVYLDAWAVEHADLSPLRALGDLAVYAQTAPEQIGGRIREAEVVISNKVPITAEVLTGANALRLVVASATGMDHIDRAACRARDVHATNVEGYATESVAQYTVAAAMQLRFRLAERNRYVRGGSYARSGRWTNPSPGWRELDGAWGVVGLGAIGRRVGQLARSLGCATKFYSASGPREERDFGQVSLAELLETCAVVSVHAPGVPRYRDLLDAGAVARLTPASVLVVAGRGGTVDEAAVANALRAGRLGGAAFDVFAAEPPAADNPLLAEDLDDRVLLTPHMAWTSDQAIARLVRGLADRIETFAASH